MTERSLAVTSQQNQSLRRWFFQGLAWRMRRESIETWMLLLLKRR